MYGRFLSFLGGGAFFLTTEDDAPTSVFLKGQHPVMVDVEGGGCSGSGHGRDIASYRGRGRGLPRPLMASQSLEAAVASVTSPLMAA
jgi:hypothetical protein